MQAAATGNNITNVRKVSKKFQKYFFVFEKVKKTCKINTYY